MKKNKIYDYIICGGGQSGLYLAHEMINDSYFNNNKILVIEKSQKNINDRTWSFWEKGKGKHDDIVIKKWDKAYFSAKNFEINFSMHPYKFKTIQGIDFYNKIINEINKCNNVDILYTEVIEINKSKELIEVITKENLIRGRKVFSSIYEPLKNSIQYPLLKQHFIGWFIETKKNIFNSNKITFMDFDIPQKGNTRFMYILPFSKNKALIEYTLFSKNLIPESEYEKEIINYLEKLNSGNYKILSKEKGIIPMTSYPFWKKNTSNYMNIGTAGGWTKSSTGFTFFKTLKKVNLLINHIKSNKNLNEFEKKNKYWWYDSLLIDILYKENHLGEYIFKRMFTKNNPKLILRFLDEKTSLYEDLKFIKTFPIKTFVKAFFSRLSKF
ncbi:MAG: lycopene cyclase family protein [Flavobacteriaceae bacterium]|nr:lycopene cyclase family protein [Flavobacteriaceae bacterium]